MMHGTARSPWLVLVAAAALSCQQQASAPQPKAATPAPEAKPPADAKERPARAVPPSDIDVKKAELEAAHAPAPLTAEEQRLIDADPKDLTQEERRKRAFALRKKIMQNPDSPAAQQLESIRKGVESGEIVPQLPPTHPPIRESLPDGSAPKTEPAPSDSKAPGAI